MTDEKIGFVNTVTYTLRDADGEIKDRFVQMNQIQETARTAVRDDFETNINRMAISTGARPDTTSGLVSETSFETTSNSTTGNFQADFEATFTCTAGGGWSIQSAGIGIGLLTTTSNLYFCDNLTVSMSENDTLTIEWDVTVNAT